MTKSARKKTSKIDIPCTYCGKENPYAPSRIKRSKRLFCNNICYGKWKSENLVGEHHYGWKGGKVKTPCIYCGTENPYSLCDIKDGKHYFCNKICEGKWNSESLVILPCTYCGTENPYIPSRVKEDRNYFCNSRCYGKWWSETKVGENHPNWKGGRHITKDGYVFVYMGNGIYKAEHRLVMENHLKRKLKRKEIVHHINEIGGDNRLDNLQVVSISEHNLIHASEG